MSIETQTVPGTPNTQEITIERLAGPIRHQDVVRFQALFHGGPQGYGQQKNVTHAEAEAKKKLDPKYSSAWTVGGPASIDRFRSHIEGLWPSLGLAPLHPDGSCYFGGLDYDNHVDPPQDVDYQTLCDRVRALDLPLVVCRSRSGGAHLFLFLKAPAPAARVIATLTHYGMLLNFKSITEGGAQGPPEVFPKQPALTGKGIGNWINLPYHHAVHSPRFAFNRAGVQLSLTEFLDFAESVRVSLDEPLLDSSTVVTKKSPRGATEDQREKRNTHLMRVGCALRVERKEGDELLSLLLVENDKFPSPPGPLPTAEVERIVQSVMRYAAGGPQLTDLGNTERVVVARGHDMRYVLAKRKWMHWTGMRWAADGIGQALRWTQEVIESIREEAAVAGSEELRKALRAHAKKSHTPHAVEAALKGATWRTGIAAEADWFDANPHAFNCQNGTLDVRTRELRPHDRTDLITRLAPVAYDPAATCARWRRFIDEVTCGDSDLARFLQQALSLSLTGVNPDEVFFVLLGHGSNGKTVMLETIRDVIGDYAKAASFDTFLHATRGSGGGPREDVVRLQGSRFVTAGEAGDGRAWDEALLKLSTGNDKMTQRGLYQESQEATPTYKLWFATNTEPRVRDNSDGMWRRMLLVPFRAQFSEADRDLTLRDKLRAERAGILNWLMDGYQDYQAAGRLVIPQVVKDASARYRKEQDVLGNFLEETTEHDANAWVSVGVFYAAYVRWCSEQGTRPEYTKPRFGTLLRRPPHNLTEPQHRRMTPKGPLVRAWQGYRLKMSEGDVAQMLDDLAALKDGRAF